jgi:TP901 family phage tail tape measure protein
MTSIWNNFDDGSKSLEYYADVITALGAATASSSEEIATGLEKFAAVAETTGLSYEYATAALATVTAETRQSADVVGTAFKTLFARIQDLELGKTLEDGVTTGKYAQALETVGVKVIEANGDLRDMDLILNDLGKRWDTLTSAQQVSLAQTVAGMRQYNQFLALMSNWDVMQQNLLTAQTSEGELTKQQDIWSESWEAANKRVEAASQDLYDDLIDDDFFIKITDMFAKIIDGVGDLVDAMGGLRGLLPLLISGMTTLFG